MADERYLSVDWRDCPPINELMLRMEHVFEPLAREHKAYIRTKGDPKRCVFVQEGEQPMIKRLVEKTERKASASMKYWPCLWAMSVAVGKLLADNQQVMARFLEYKEVCNQPARFYRY